MLEMKSENQAGELLRTQLRGRVLPGTSRPWIPPLALPGKNKAGQSLKELNLQNMYLSLEAQNSLGFVWKKKKKKMWADY